MKISFVKSLMLLSLFVLIIFSSGCSLWSLPENEVTEPRSEGSVDPVELRIVLLGYAPPELELAIAKLNKMAVGDLGFTVNIEVMYPADFQRPYELLLSAGAPVDLLWAASWNKYQIYAREGAFLPLDSLLQSVVPDYYASIPQEIWEKSRIDGEIYGLPQLSMDYNAKGFVYREDLRKKYDLPEITDLATIEIYLECIRDSEPQMLPTDEGAELGVWYIYSFLNNLEAGFGPQHAAYGLAVKFDNRTELYDEWQSSEFKEAAETVKRWYDKGFWSTGVTANQKDSARSFLAGKCAGVFSQTDPRNVHDNIVQPVAMMHPDWEVGYLNFSAISGAAIRKFPTFQSWAIPVSASYPEQALEFVEQVMLDKEYNQLLWMGIQNVHYKIDEQGYYVQLGNRYHKGSVDLNSLYNEEFQVYPETYSFLQDVFSLLEPIAIDDFWSFFVEDYDSYSSERAAMQQVAETYLVPIKAGIVPDVDEAIALLTAKAQEAGRDKIFASMTQQWQAYCEAQGIE